jgi:hypothetical protein
MHALCEVVGAGVIVGGAGVEVAALGDVERRREPHHVGFRDRQGDEGAVDPERMETPALAINHRGGRAGQRIRIEAPEKDANIWDVVAPSPRVDLARLEGAHDPVKRAAADPFQRAPVAQVRARGALAADVVHILGDDETLEELDGGCVPPRHVARELFDGR